MSHSASSNIPRPKGDIRVGIQSKMGLENDRELYEQIESCIHRLAGEYLDMDEAFSYQDRAKMRSLFLEALREYPLLKRFENGWPVKGLLQNLLRVSNGHRSKGPNCAAAKSASTSTTSAASQNAQGNRASSCSSPPSRPARQPARPFQKVSQVPHTRTAVHYLTK
ncbi:hypothetical protein K474DRAFT_557836 [Panus rudis PR-1116 ss-1]|nr:hypothetical protein K474DRAFT_557836 [Panus rudis PR-1116 ss-1]